MYSSDLSDAQWQLIKKTLNYTNRKRKYSLRTIWNGILYVVKTGCQWRMLPNDFPKWQIVYYYRRVTPFIKWVDLEEFDLLLEKIRGKIRFKKRSKNRAKRGSDGKQKCKMG